MNETIEAAGRALAWVMVTLVAAWMVYALVRLVIDGIRFRRGMLAQLEANQREIDLTLARAQHQQAELDGMLSALREPAKPFPLAAPVIEKVRMVSSWSAWKGCAKAADGDHVAEINPNDFGVRCRMCGERAMRLPEGGQDNL